MKRQDSSVISRRQMLAGLGAGALNLVSLRINSLKAAEKKRPNIVVIMADDLGWGEISCHDAPTQTPNLDRFFAEGLELGCHMVMPVCSPTRAAFLTGRSPVRVGITPGVINADTGCTMPGEEVTLGEAFSAAGYATAVVGKWHLGYAPRPNGQGFELAYGNYGAAVDYFTRMTARGYYDWYENDEILKAEGYNTDLIAGRAVRYINDSGDKPFFLYVPFTAVHNPVQAKAADLKRVSPKVTDKDRRTHDAMTVALDDGVGNILAALETKGIAGNTVVLFMSDNGATTTGSSLPFRGRKHSLYDGGIRTPAAIRWPGRIKGGKRTDELVGVEDWYPTLLTIAGVSVPQGPKLDGMDVSKVLLNGVPSPRKFYSWIWDDHDAIRTSNWKLLRWRDKKELYNLAADPAESNNLIDESPGIAKELEAKMDAWQASLSCHPCHVPVKLERPAQAVPEGNVIEIRMKCANGRKAVPIVATLGRCEYFQLTPGDRMEYDMMIAKGSTKRGFYLDVSRGPIPQRVLDSIPHKAKQRQDNPRPLYRFTLANKRGFLFGRRTVVDQYGIEQNINSDFQQAYGKWARRVIGLGSLAPTMMSEIVFLTEGKEEGECLIYLDNIVLHRRNDQSIEFYRNGTIPDLHKSFLEDGQDVSIRTVPYSQCLAELSRGNRND